MLQRWEQLCYVQMRCQISREVFTGKTVLRVTPTDCSDKEIDEETECVSESNSGTQDSWLSDPAHDIGKLDILDGGYA